MIGGTSTGGVLAIMLGRLRMTVDECIEVYREMSEEIFHKQRHRLKPNGNVQGRFDTIALERAIQRCVARAELSKDALLYDTDDASCRVFVCAMSKETSQIMQFTSYISRDGMSDLLRSAKIWEAARATSAATSFFAPIKVGPNHEEFVDGALGANNPVRSMWDEAQQVWPSARFEDQVELLVSIGTGVPGITNVGDKFWEVAKTLEKLAAETQNTADQFRRDHRDLVWNGKYYRFNVDRGLEAIGLEEYSKISTIVAATRHYLHHEAEQHLESFARKVGTMPSDLRPNDAQNTFSQQPTPATSNDQLPSSAPSRETYTFHSLTDESKYVNRNEQVPWRKFTEPAMSIYERIYEAAKGPDGRVELSSYTILLPPSLRSTILPTFWALLSHPERSLSKNLTLSLTFMLHLRSAINWQPESVSERRRRILRRAGEWVDCSCGCGRKWNFVNDIGMWRPRDMEGRCKGVEYREMGAVRRRWFGGNRRRVDASNREAWKRRRVE